MALPQDNGDNHAVTASASLPVHPAPPQGPDSGGGFWDMAWPGVPSKTPTCTMRGIARSRCGYCLAMWLVIRFRYAGI
jgi:hypothetical protein